MIDLADRARRALFAAFGDAPLHELVPVTGGLSGASVYRIRDKILRLDTPTNAFGDVGRAYACQAIAADAGLAPPVFHADAADAATIVEAIDAQPLSTHPWLAADLARMAADLHRTQPFPPLVDYLAGMEALIARHRARPLLDPAATSPVLARYALLAGAYRTRPQDLVSSHNDLNPGNVLYDGKRLWLIDWEAAFLADRFVDLATIANWFAPDGAEPLLAAYFGREPTDEERARLYLMRQVNHVFYGMVMLNGCADERPDAKPAGADLSGPTLAEIGVLLRQGRFDMTAWDSRLAYAKARLTAANAGLSGPAFDAALDLVL